MVTKGFISKNLLNSAKKLNSRKINENWFIKNGFADEWDEIKENPTHHLRVILYGSFHCRVCGKEIIQTGQPISKLKHCSVKCAMRSKERSEKISTAWKSGELAQKRRQVMVERFGVESNFHRDDVQRKINHSEVSKNSRKRIDGKRREINEKRRSLNEKRLKEFLLRHGVAHNENFKGIQLKRSFEVYPLSLFEKISNKTLTLFDAELKEFSTSKKYSMLRHIYGFRDNKISSLHNHFIEWLNEMGETFIVNDRKTLSGKELDIFIPSRQIAFEINGSYWHSADRVGPHYHLEKSLMCADKGITLIHVFDFDDVEFIKNHFIRICERSITPDDLSDARLGLIECVFPDVDKGSIQRSLPRCVQNNVYDCGSQKIER